jgi:hypothetical protein
MGKRMHQPIEGVITYQGVVVEQQQQLPPRQRCRTIAGVEKALVLLAAPDPQPGQLPPQLGFGISGSSSATITSKLVALAIATKLRRALSVIAQWLCTGIRTEI